MSNYLQKHLSINSTGEVAIKYRDVLDTVKIAVPAYFGYYVDSSTHSIGILTTGKEWYEIPFSNFVAGKLDSMDDYLVRDFVAAKIKVEKVELPQLPVMSDVDMVKYISEIRELKTKLMTTEELKKELDVKLKEAMLAKDAQKLSAVRMIKAAITTAEKVNQAVQIDWMKVMQTEAKKRQQAADEFTKGNAADKAAAELYERDLIESFLPAKMSEEQTIAALTTIKGELSLSVQKDMGKLIKEFQARYPGLQDGGTVSRISKLLLS